jgi:hypothetical protein
MPRRDRKPKGHRWPCPGPGSGPSIVPRDEPLSLSNAELEQVRKIARREGISVEEAASKLVQSALARRVRRRTGKAPARVYSIKKR